MVAAGHTFYRLGERRVARSTTCPSEFLEFPEHRARAGARGSRSRSRRRRSRRARPASTRTPPASASSSACDRSREAGTVRARARRLRRRAADRTARPRSRSPSEIDDRRADRLAVGEPRRVPQLRVGEEPGRRLPRRRAGAGGVARARARAVPVPAHAADGALRAQPRDSTPRSTSISRCGRRSSRSSATTTARWLDCARARLGDHVRGAERRRRSAARHARAARARATRCAGAPSSCSRSRAHHGVDTLVLGAWGAGVFRNDPVTVADAFAARSRATSRACSRAVVFAVPDRERARTTARSRRGSAGNVGAQTPGPWGPITVPPCPPTIRTRSALGRSVGRTGGVLTRGCFFMV